MWASFFALYGITTGAQIIIANWLLNKEWDRLKIFENLVFLNAFVQPPAYVRYAALGIFGMSIVGFVFITGVLLAAIVKIRAFMLSTVDAQINNKFISLLMA